MGRRKRKRSSSSEYTVAEIHASTPAKRSSRTPRPLQRDNAPNQINPNDSGIGNSTEEPSSPSSFQNPNAFVQSAELVQDSESLQLSPTSSEQSQSSEKSENLENVAKFQEAYKNYHRRDEYEMVKTLLYHYKSSGIENFEEAEELEKYVAEEEIRRCITKPDYEGMYIDHKDYITAKKLLNGFERDGYAKWHDAQKLRDFIELAERLHPSFAQTSNGIASSGDAETGSIESLQPVESLKPNQDTFVNLLQMFPEISDSDENVHVPHSSPNSSVSSNQSLKPLEPLTSSQTPIRPPEAPQPQRFKSNTMANDSSTKRRRNLKNDLGNHSLETYGSLPASSTENAPDKAEELFQDSSDSVKADGDEEVSDEDPSTSTSRTTVSLSDAPIAKRRRKLDFKQAQQPSTSDTKISTSSTKFISEPVVDIDKESQLYESALQLFANFRSIGQEKIATAFEQVLLNHTSGSNNVAENAAGNSSKGRILSNYYQQLGQLVERFKENGRHVLAAEIDQSLSKDNSRLEIDKNLNQKKVGQPYTDISLSDVRKIKNKDENLQSKTTDQSILLRALDNISSGSVSVTTEFVTMNSVSSGVKNSSPILSSNHVNNNECDISLPIRRRNNGEGKATNLTIYPPSYEFVEDYSRNKKRFTKYLIVFVDEKRIHCYRYYMSGSNDTFICAGCDNLPEKRNRLILTARVQNVDEKESVLLLKTNHHCEPVLFSNVLKNADRTIQKPNYEMIEIDGKKYLHVFTSINKNNCECIGYKFHFSSTENKYCCSAFGCSVRAFEVNTSTGKTVLRYTGHHKCDAKQLQYFIVKLPNYVKKKKNHIFIFDENSSNMGYEYGFDAKQDSYYCLQCARFNTRIGAKLIKCENGDFLQLSTRNHKCSTIQFIPDLDKLIFTRIECPKDEAIATPTKLEKILYAENDDEIPHATYVATIKGPEAPIEERYSHIFYIGYTENIVTRLPYHYHHKSTVREMIDKYGIVYLVPIFESSSGRCLDMEAAGIELRRQGSIDFHFMNYIKGDWKSKTLKEICKNRKHDNHLEIAQDFKRIVFEALKKTENFVSSRTLRVK